MAIEWKRASLEKTGQEYCSQLVDLTCYSFARHAAVEFSSSVPRKTRKIGFCAQKKLEKAKKVVYTVLQQPGNTLCTGSKIACLANAVLEWPLKPIEAHCCVKRLGSSVEIETLQRDDDRYACDLV